MIVKKGISIVRKALEANGFVISEKDNQQIERKFLQFSKTLLLRNGLEIQAGTLIYMNSRLKEVEFSYDDKTVHFKANVNAFNRRSACDSIELELIAHEPESSEDDLCLWVVVEGGVLVFSELLKEPDESTQRTMQMFFDAKAETKAAEIKHELHLKTALIIGAALIVAAILILTFALDSLVPAYCGIIAIMFLATTILYFCENPNPSIYQKQLEAEEKLISLDEENVKRFAQNIK